MKKGNEFVVSENWWIEDDRAWFVEVMNNILCCLNLNTHECEMMIDIPDTNLITFRLNPHCVKCGSSIFCLPGCGECIWVYDLEDKQFSRIELDNPDKFQLTFDFWIYDNQIFAVSGELKKVIEINAKEKKIVKDYTILTESIWTKSVRVGNEIYCLPTKTDKVYAFDLATKTTKEYTLPNSGKSLYTISYDGKLFWMSGYGKEIYTWEKESNTLMTVSGFPEGFGVYNFDVDAQEVLDYRMEAYKLPMFLHSVMAGGHIWFIPFQTNQILYVDIAGDKVSEFVIDEENETRGSLSLIHRHLAVKYMLEYVKDERYIGLFSLKNKRVLEIDAKELTYRWLDFHMCESCLIQYDEKKKAVYHEEDLLGIVAYNTKLKYAKSTMHSATVNKVGVEIYKAMLQ